MNKKIIITVAAIVVVVIAITLLGQRASTPYVLSDQESLDYVSALNEVYAFPKGVDPIKQATEGIVLIDLRDIDLYSRQHLKGALNVPVADILNADPLEQIKDLSNQGRLIVLFGEEESFAAPVVYLLKQMGVKGARALAGGFSYWNSGGKADSLKLGGFLSETPIGDYAKLMLLRAGSDSTKKLAPAIVKPKKVAPKPVAKQAAAEGGC